MMATHPRGEQISAYLDGMLDTRQMRQVAQHLDGCADCRSLQRSFHHTKKALGALAAPEAPGPEFWSDTFRRLRTDGEALPAFQAGRRTALVSRVRRSWRSLGAVAAVAALGVAAVCPFCTPPAQNSGPVATDGSVDSVDLSSLVRAHTAFVARQPLADPDRQTMMSADTDDGNASTDVPAEAAGDQETSAADAAH